MERMMSSSPTITERPGAVEHADDADEIVFFPTVGEILSEDFLKPAGLSQNALARAIGVPPRRINEIVLGKRAVTADTDLRLARYFGLSDGFFLRVQMTCDLRETKRKLVATLAAIEPRPLTQAA
jgi:addiction module HigA family antidote